MPTVRVPMHQVGEILRLTFDAGLPSREVARCVGVGSTSVRTMLQRFHTSTLNWPLPNGITDAAFEHELYGLAGTRASERQQAEPDWAGAGNRELRRKHVKLQIVWDEYFDVRLEGYRYSRFCDLYRAWKAKVP